MATKRDQIQQIRDTVGDRLAEQSPEFRERVMYWLDVVDAEMDSGVFDLHFAFAIQSAMAEQESRKREQSLAAFEWNYRQSIEHHGQVFQEFKQVGSTFADVRKLVDKVGEQQEQAIGLDHHLAKIYNAVNSAITRTELLQPVVRRLALLGMAGLVGSLCFPAGWLLGKQRGWEEYGQQLHVNAAENLWKLNPEILRGCIDGYPEPCSVTLRTTIETE